MLKYSIKMVDLSISPYLATAIFICVLVSTHIYFTVYCHMIVIVL